MLQIIAIVLAVGLSHQTQELTVPQTWAVTSTSVLVRMKQYVMTEEGTIKRGVGGCSGTFISSKTVLTAGHCFNRPTTDVWVRGPYDTKGLKASVIKLDPEHDLALLQIDDARSDRPFARLATSVRVGEQVINVGSPWMFEFLVSEGVVASLHFIDKQFKATYTITTAMINSGSSGGGAFNSNGELIGVNTMTVGGPFGWAGISMAVDLETIRRFLK